MSYCVVIGYTFKNLNKTNKQKKRQVFIPSHMKKNKIAIGKSRLENNLGRTHICAPLSRRLSQLIVILSS